MTLVTAYRLLLMDRRAMDRALRIMERESEAIVEAAVKEGV